MAIIVKYVNAVESLDNCYQRLKRAENAYAIWKHQAEEKE